MIDFDVERYKTWKGRVVVVVAKVDKLDGSKVAVELTGELRAVHERGIMVRPKGRQTPEMIDTADIEEFTLYDEIPQPIESKKLNEVVFGSIRQHLADRHGVALDDVNAKGFTEGQAYDFHLEEHSDGSPKMSHHHEG